MKKRNMAGRLAPIVQIALITGAAYLLLLAVVLVGTTPEQHDIHVGAPASIDILATKDVNDVVTTEEYREAAAAAVEPSYRSVDVSVVGDVAADLETCFGVLAGLRDGATPEEAAALDSQELAALSAALPFAITQEQYVALAEADEDTLRALFGDILARVREALNSTLPEGQEAAAISRISRALSASGYPAPLVSLGTEVMRSLVRPNMLIDEEITEANRQRARDAVEMKTCVKGEVIVRRGDIVTPAQYTMLSSLGLLKEDSFDITLYVGIALIVLLIMGSAALYLLRFERDRLNPKALSLLSLVFVLVAALCLGISRWNTYMMPVSLGMMLLALLGGQRAALFVNLALGFTASLLTDASSGLFTMAMFSVVLMSMVSGPIILAVFSRRMQRTTTLLAGVLVGISNFLVVLAVGLVNSAELYSVLANALWAMGGGILSAVLCIGIQPLMELLFNLATNAKLIELSNPNQPLLRRLLLEAPGTYHHSIIVANLAEAAASAIGANGLLARVGAYYHDVGKLKRPIYFKENQMGDNPHDRTDPRVSAAILTAHPRDGVAMAQKARVPEPVLEIIRQHHGDGIALYFYDKAVKLYGSDQVDIAAFRYEGPRPRTKEAAAVMLADTIEAAARSVPDPDPERIDALIRKLVHDKLNDGQLDESDLTFSDLDRICRAFSTVLTGVFHERIEYPDVPLPPRVDKPEAADPAAEAKPAEAAVEAKPAAQPKPETQAEGKPAAEPRPQAESKPAAEPRPQAESKPAAEPRPQAESKPAAEPRPQAESKPAAEPAPEARSQVESKPVTEPKPRAEGKPVTQPAPEAGPEAREEAARDAH